MAAAASAAAKGTGSTTSSRFAAACGALSQYVRAADHRMHHARPVPTVRPLPLMPGADVVVPDGREEYEREAGLESGAAQLTIFYGGRVLVLDQCPADKATALLRLAARGVEPAGACGELAPATDLPVARKASLQRFMEKRKGRLATRAEPYRRPDAACRDHLTLAL